MKGGSSFLLIVVGLLLLWLVVSGRSGNLSGALTVLFNGTGATPTTTSGTSGTTTSVLPTLPSLPTLSGNPSYTAASYVSPSGALA